MSRIWHNYELWEDFQSGMYNPPCHASVDTGVTTEERIAKAVELLSNEELCEKYMRKVVREWVKGTEQVLSNRGQNRKAWLGWCACFMYGECKDIETRKAWRLLTNEQRKKANAVADRVIKEWEKEHENIFRY